MKNQEELKIQQVVAKTPLHIKDSAQISDGQSLKGLDDDAYFEMGCDIEDKSKIGQISKKSQNKRKMEQNLYADRNCSSLQIAAGTSLNMEKDDRQKASCMSQTSEVSLSEESDCESPTIVKKEKFDIISPKKLMPILEESKQMEKSNSLSQALETESCSSL